MKKGLAVLIVIVVIVVGCFLIQNPKYKSIDPKSEDENSILVNKIDSNGMSISKDSIIIATFNIQVFGQSKIKKRDVMEYLVKIITYFDVCAIQEIRSKEQNVLPTLVEQLGDDWDFVISDRIGRTSSKEQYGIVYRKSRVEILDTFQVQDPLDHLHREPHIAYCKAGDFTFSLINIHTDPDEVKTELNALDDILIAELKKEDDAILLGDLNASPDKFQELAIITNVYWVIDNQFTNTRQNKLYDNMVFNKLNCSEFKYGGVYNFVDTFNLDLQGALKISDHMPVYGVFEIAKN